MKIEVRRVWYTDLSTCGEMFVDNQPECSTLEPRADQSKGKPYCIPEGEYEVQLLFSTRFQEKTPHLLNVPGFQGIEIHPGNFSENTEGCILVGQPRKPNYVGNSLATFERLMTLLRTATDGITIRITSSQPGPVAQVQ